ncbi:MAG TPA: YggT family protein [Gemmatimonadales bacterium]|jgi:uncharacterized protein YggT (Ycf19 family)|nr:YggT family protein [Gemmatimonadales bacterium]
MDLVLRALTLAAFSLALVVLATQWAVRRKLIRPFGWWPRFVRSWSGPALRRVERRLATSGHNPQDAGLWLLGIVAVGALLLIMLSRWILGAAGLARAMRGAGPGQWLQLLLSAATWVVMTAIVVRVIGLWMGAGRFRPWMRPVYLLTDWIIEPIRRRLPPTGAVDLSPLAAYALLFLVRLILLPLLTRPR